VSVSTLQELHDGTLIIRSLACEKPSSKDSYNLGGLPKDIEFLVINQHLQKRKKKLGADYNSPEIYCPAHAPGKESVSLPTSGLTNKYKLMNEG